MMLTVLIAQAATDPISGGAGWLGAGLLGLVLGWLLLVYLPAKDKQVQELSKIKDDQMRIKDEQILLLVKTKDEAVKEIVQRFTEESREARKSAQQIMDKVCEEFRLDTVAERQTCENNFKLIAKSVDDLIQTYRGKS